MTVEGDETFIFQNCEKGVDRASPHLASLVAFEANKELH